MSIIKPKNGIKSTSVIPSYKDSQLYKDRQEKGKKATEALAKVPSALDISRKEFGLQNLKTQPQINKEIFDAGISRPIDVTKLNFKKTPQDYIKESLDKTEARRQGFRDTASFGLADKVLGTSEQGKRAIEQYPENYQTGQLAGYIAPGTAFTKGAGTAMKLIPKLNKLSSIPKLAAQEGIAGLGMGLTEGLARGEGLKESAQKGLEYGAGGALIGGLIGGASRGISNLNQARQLKNIDNSYNLLRSQGVTGTPIQQSLESIPMTRPLKQGIIRTEPNKRFNILNRDAIGKENAYNEAVATLQNKYGTNDIVGAVSDIINEGRPSTQRIPVSVDDAFDFVKSDTGIDIRKIADDMAQAQQTKIIPNSDIARLRRASGVASDRQYQLLDDIANNRISPNTARQTSFDAIKTVNELPDDINLLEDYVRVANDRKSKGLKINLQLFAEAEKKLNNARKFISNRTKDNMPEIVTSQQKNKKSISDRLNDFYTKWTDSNINIKPASKDAYTRATNSKKVGGTVSYILNDGLVDQSGKEIGTSVKNIISDIPQEKEKDFLQYILMKHNVSRYNQGKPIFSMFNADESIQEANRILQNNPEFKNIESNLREFINKFGDEWLVNTGLVSRESLENMRAINPDYVPTQRFFEDIEAPTGKGLKSGFVNQGNTIKKATGSDRNILNPIENIMNMVNRTVRTARKNQIGQTILNEVRSNPNELRKYAEILPTTLDEQQAMKQALIEDGIENLVDETGKFVHPAFKSQRPNVVTVLEDGEPVYLKINDKKLLEALDGSTSTNIEINPKLKAFNNVFKGLITQKNPFFAVRNIARDVPTAYIFGSEKNPFKFTRDLIKASKSILKNEDIYKKYKALGGGESQFFNPENVTEYKKIMNKNPSMFKKLINSVEKFNAFTETVPRLAEFERTLYKTDDIQKALYEAGEITTNFSRGGKSAKYIDSIVPYFNASIQGLDRTARGVIDKPVQFLLKGLTGITVPTVALHMINKNIPEYQQLDDRTKDTNYLFYTGDGKFIKLPKSRELGVLFGSLFERVLENDFSNYANTALTNFAPANPITNNIASPLFSLRSNKDFAGRTIVPQNMQDISPRYQYDETTSEIAKQIGNITNLSPKQIDYIIKSYTGVIGNIIQPATTKKTSVLETLVTRPFTSDSAYNNKSSQQFYDNLQMLKTRANDKNFVEDIPSKVLTEEEQYKNAFNSVSTNLSKLKKHFDKLPTKEEQRKERMKLNSKLTDINNALKENDLKEVEKISQEFKKQVKMLKLK